MSERLETAVLTMKLGWPRQPLEAVEPFLFNLFSDPTFVQLPLGFLYQPALARRLACKRAPGARKSYERPGGRSPFLELTRRQAARLGPG